MDGNDYRFTVQEVDEFGEDFVPAHYTKTEEGLKVVNCFEPIPQEKETPKPPPIVPTGEVATPLFVSGAVLLLALVLIVIRRRKLKDDE